MTRKAVVARLQALRDIDEAIDHYRLGASDQIAVGFIDALERALDAIARNPAAGSPRYGHELDLPGLRSQMLRRYPYLIFYVEAADHVDVWRVLHAHRNIPAWMRGSGAE